MYTCLCYRLKDKKNAKIWCCIKILDPIKKYATKNVQIETSFFFLRTKIKVKVLLFIYCNLAIFTKCIWTVCIIRNAMLACCSCCWYNKIVDLHFSPNFQVSSMSQWIFNGSLVFACAPLTEIGSEAQWIIHFCQLIHHVHVNSE